MNAPPELDRIHEEHDRSDRSIKRIVKVMLLVAVPWFIATVVLDQIHQPRLSLYVGLAGGALFALLALWAMPLMLRRYLAGREMRSRR